MSLNNIKGDKPVLSAIYGKIDLGCCCQVMTNLKRAMIHSASFQKFHKWRNVNAKN